MAGLTRAAYRFSYVDQGECARRCSLSESRTVCPSARARMEEGEHPDDMR